MINKKNKQNRIKNKTKDSNVKNENRKVDNIISGNIVEGRNAVSELLKGEKTIEYILISKGEISGSIKNIIRIAKEKKVVIKEVDKKKLDSMSETKIHQGVIAVTTDFEYSTVEEILNYAKEKNEDPFIILLDEIEDPHNLGSIVRTAEVCGAHGIIIPKRRNVGVTPIVYKTSAGAVEHMKIAKVTNLNSCIDELKNNGVWVYGTDILGKSYCNEVNYEGSVAIVIGSEGKGMSKHTKEKCDVLVKIPMVGRINSLNASVAGGIVMYEILKQKISRDKK
ncbi:23S rRNA (guanosine(2251)-2'-O)-methyltransferase RlmB [Hathewaya histolytica]|uniref:TrmH family RNA methyltransferase n=1 Tax=Hathewaya histolytica TaxID=1498 RepID=A0A4U9RTV9_HATHI|nr:23S rRNA (guanosine(2251)-2'-O)-methyltransferase RlmB [Hathewaya histolytica]VTQ95181.1 TrmH family RNA methyltransferase [Hathewaya histolytica]